ncbi:hypothetical protein PS874_01076 [Pseudomonas fluorescens]|nr:hypothetical protein PS874_01076 [Pseudomonas fluorescens]
MSPKPPPKGPITVDIHPRPRPPSDGYTPLPDTLPRVDFGSPVTTNPRNPSRTIGTPRDGDLDAITPAPTVSASELPSVPVPAPTASQRPLEHYWVASTVKLPAPDALGFRTFKGRQYVDVPGGGVVHIEADPDTGLYRAKLRSELQATGPVLVRDPESTLWYSLNDVEPTTYSLTNTRLEAFRTSLDFTGVEPGSDGLYRREGKLYVVIENQAYQALHDLEASSPQAPVMRIVRAEDPVALDDNNVYVATRPGRSEPVVYDVLDGWVGTKVPGAGGMMRSEPDRPVPQGLKDRLLSAVDRLRSPESRAADLYPSLDPEQIKALVRSLGDDVDGGLARRKTEYKTLKDQLKSWITQSSTSSTPEPTKRWVEHVAKEIKRCWRQKTGTTLKLPPGNGTLPALNADFSHVRTLDLDDITWSDTADTFLTGFSRLERLTVTRSTLTKLPAAVAEMSNLSTLNLSSNRIRLDEQTGATLSALSKLARINAVTRLEQNAFPSQYWRKFDSYWRRLNEAHPELMSPAYAKAFDSDNSWAQRYRALYPGKSIKECREYIWSHEKGTFSPKLNGLEQEFSLLKSQLDDWVYSGEGNRLGYIRNHQIGRNIPTRDHRNTARDKIISCWRRETAQKLANDGTPIGLELDLSGLTLPTLPDLSVDFSHVGSLKLSNMNLTASPEGFLTRFRHLRWLDMSNNRLTDLPPAVGEMHGMTRLFLQKNQLQLTAETAQILSGRTTLRALFLQDNPQLGELPDFSLISDMRAVNMANTGINTWPTGLFDQPLLTDIDLSNNQITTLPDFVTAPAADRLAHSVQVNSGTRVFNNPLSDATRVRLEAYRVRLENAGTPLRGAFNLLTSSAPDVRLPEPVVRPGALHPAWLVGLTAEQVSIRTAQWNMLREQHGSDGFFNIINSRTDHPDFRRQVWEVIDVITENNPQSRVLRRELFARACEAGCTDLAAATFTDLQILAISHKARIQAKLELNGAQLVDLSKGLFRLKQVDDIAAADLESSRAIVNDPATSTEQRNHHRNRIRDPHEMTMAYRFGLKDRLQLPFQPEALTFIGMAKVTPTMLDAAYRKVVALDGSPEVVEALVSMDFWQDYITHKYQSQFEDSRQPFQDQQAILDAQKSQGKLKESEYKTQTDDLQAQHAIAEATLIQVLTRQELQPGPTIEERPASDTSGNQATSEAG